MRITIGFKYMYAVQVHDSRHYARDERRRTSSAADRLARRWLSPSEAASLALVPEVGFWRKNVNAFEPTTA